MMRILFRGLDVCLVRVSFVVFFTAEYQADGSFVVYFQDSEGDFWSCKSMSFDDYDEYAYHLTVNGFIDLRKYEFVLDE